MRTFSRPGRILWLFGLMLLLGTIAGAGWLLNHSTVGAEGNANPARDKSMPFDGRFIIAFGYVDVPRPPGITPIYPLVSGKVKWVAEEGSAVDQGKKLLELDDEMAQSDVKKAQIALDDAKEVLAQAGRLSEKHDLEIEAQEKAIEAFKEDKEAVAQQVLKLKHLVDKKIGGNEFDLKSAQAKVKKIEAGIAAEQAKLAILKLADPQHQIKRANLDVKLKTQTVTHAKLALKEYTKLAPTNGTVLRVFTSVGEVLGPNPKAPAIEFCPKLPRIIRAEVSQEWASKVMPEQDVIIEDDSSAGHHWKGKVLSVSDWFTHRRSIIQEPFQFNDVRTLECIIVVTDEPPAQKLRIGQRMRVMINQGGP
jgi:multidrug resistance efflux pump